MTTRSIRALLHGLIDYAGLYPPAGLTMQDAVRNYERYRSGPHAWMLNKFVVPAARVPEVPSEFPLSIVGVDEVRATTVEEIRDIAAGADGRTIYVEVTDLELIEVLGRHGLRAKFRTGGVTAEAFPPIESVAEFLRECRRHGVAFKATAGLHHPLRCVKALTYEPNAPIGTMHGFVNVFLAAALLDDADLILNETDPAAFAFDDDGVSWRGRRVTVEELETTRAFATSFGSCSFEEPIGDLQQLGWID